jgi:DNA-binding LytR/AlgR family response regulator
MRIFIVEDDELQLDATCMAVEEEGHEVAGASGDADEAFELIAAVKPDLVLVDIALPGKNNGLSIGKWLHTEMHIPHIFTTSFRDGETIKEAVETHPVSYLTKPIDQSMLKAAIELSKIKGGNSSETNIGEVKIEESSKLFFVKVGEKHIKIDISEIRWLEAGGENYSYIALSAERKFAIRSTLKELLTILHPLDLLQTHRSFIVNTDYIETVNEQNQTISIDGQEIPIGRTYRKAVEHRMNKL